MTSTRTVLRSSGGPTNALFAPPSSPRLALAIIRVATGGFLLFGHGIGKVLAFESLKAGFPDPLGLGPEVTLVLAALTETVAAAFLVVGFRARLAALPLLATLGVAALVVHTGGFSDRELPLLYAVALVVVAVGGPGAFSLDEALASRGARARRRARPRPKRASPTSSSPTTLPSSFRRRSSRSARGCPA